MDPYIPFVHDIRHELLTLAGLHSDAELDQIAAQRGDRSYRFFGDLPLAARWIKDDKTVLLYAAQSLQALGIRVNPGEAGLIKTSKRLSRLFRPSRFFTAYAGDELRVRTDERLDPDLWDGMALIRRELVVDIARRSPWLADLAEADPDRHFALMEEMMTVERVEITVLTGAGQIKGHALVIDTHEGYDEVAGLLSDVVVAPGAYKPEVTAIDGRTFIAIEPVHGQERAEIDIQSLINLWPFVKPFVRPALAQLRRDNRLLLDSLYRGDYRFPALPASELDEETYPLMLVSRYGIDPLSYPSVMNMVVRGRLSQIDRMRRHLHLPLPNLQRRYLAVDANSGGRFLAGWGVDLTSLYVGREEYGQIAAVLGGADLDDALMVLPFLDWDLAERTLIWRQPNQTGEYWLLEGWGGLGLSEEPVFADSRTLFTRIDRQADRPPAVPADAPPAEWNAAVARLKGNAGAIGLFANYMMLAVSATGELPPLPCSFESIIDAAVKDGRDVSAQVREVKSLMGRLCATTPLAGVLLPRAPRDLRDEGQVEVAAHHYLDLLHTRLTEVYDALDAERQTLRDQANLPIAGLLAAGDVDRAEKAYRYFFSLAEGHKRVVIQDGRPVTEPDWPAIGRLFADQLEKVDEAERDAILVGILAYAGVRGRSDLPCFMATTAAKAFCAMQRYAVERGEVPSLAVQVQHVWFNDIQAERCAVGSSPYGRMAEVSADIRAYAKGRVAGWVDVLQTIVVAGREVWASSRLLGLLPKSVALPDGQYQVLAAAADTAEGSLHARLALLFTL
jgi:hypothetical protein